MRAPELAGLARLDDAAFRALFGKSAVKRIGRARFVRNVLIAIGNSGEPALAVEAERLLDDPSPLVRGAAVWALARLDRGLLERGTVSRAGETDPGVIDEWDAALAMRARCPRYSASGSAIRRSITLPGSAIVLTASSAPCAARNALPR